MSYVTVESHGAVAVLRLSRPEARNAMTPRMLHDLREQIVESDRTNCAIVLAGAGESFSAGFDLKLCRDDPGELSVLLRRLSSVIATLKTATVPVVIAAHGAAVAGACALFGGADYVIADRRAKLGYPVVRLGLSPAVSAPFLSSQISAGDMRRLMLNPGVISGQEALAIGLVHECVDSPAEVLPAAIAAAKILAAKPRVAFAATKRLLNEIEDEHQLATSPPPSAGWPARGLEISLATAASDETRSRLASLQLK